MAVTPRTRSVYSSPRADRDDDRIGGGKKEPVASEHAEDNVTKLFIFLTKLFEKLFSINKRV